jgi:ribosomal protein S18 acetylase RimI-like enzyme
VHLTAGRGVVHNAGMGVDIERVDELNDEVEAALRRLLPQLSRSASMPDRDGLAGVVAHEANVLLVALVDGRIVGTLTLVIFPLITGVRAWIEDVVVDEEARGAGVGAALTREAVRIADARGARTVDLTSRPDRVAANKLYLGLGFEARNSTVFRFTPPAPD